MHSFFFLHVGVDFCVANYQGATQIARQFIELQQLNYYTSGIVHYYYPIEEFHWNDEAQTVQFSLKVQLFGSVTPDFDINFTESDKPDVSSVT